MNHFLKFYLSWLVWKFSGGRVNDLWLVGENLGRSARDNGYYFFEYLSEKQSEVESKFIIDKNSVDLKVVSGRDGVIFLNSFSHYLAYWASKYSIVSHGIRDVVPEYFVSKKKKLKPIIYIQHGVIKYKKVFYNSLSYNGALLRFVVSSKDEREIVESKMMPKSIEQKLNDTSWKIASHKLAEECVLKGLTDSETKELYRGSCQSNYEYGLNRALMDLEKRVGIPAGRIIESGLPRFDSLINESKNLKKEGPREILVFPTWREYLQGISKNEFLNTSFFRFYSEFLTSKKLMKLLDEHNLVLNFFLHIEKQQYINLFEGFATSRVRVLNGNESIRSLVLGSDILVTDYSSLSWDFLVLKKPTIFAHFDYVEYKSERGDYTKSSDEWCGTVCSNSDQVIDELQKKVSESGVDNSGADSLYLGNSSKTLFDQITKIPKKVYFLVYNIYGIGGTVRTTINSANYLFSRGFDVEIISIRRTSKLPRFGLHPGIRVQPLYDARRGAYKLINKSLRKTIFCFFVKILRRHPSKLFLKGEDLYYMVSLLTDLQIVRKLSAIREGVVVSTLPSLNFASLKHCGQNVVKVGQEHKHYDAHADDIKERIERKYKYLDCLTVLTSESKEKYEKYVSSDKIRVQPNGVALPKRYSLHPETKKILFLGRFVAEKGLHYLVRAFSMVVEEYPDWTLEIVGRGVLESELRELISELKLDKNLRILPPVVDVDKVFSECEFFVLPSISEGFGMVIIEGFSNARPVVCFDIPNGPKEIVRDGENGLKAKPFDEKDFGDKIKLLISDRELREKLALEARSTAERHYSVEKTGKILEDALLNLS